MGLSTSKSSSTVHPSSSSSSSSRPSEFVQNVLVMRHGDRLDTAVHGWTRTAERPWDPPLTGRGKFRAMEAGSVVKGLGFKVHRVVSPFRRCLETASEVVTALCEVEGEGDGVGSVDSSRVKVSVEYGLCEIFGTRAISRKIYPKNEIWFPHISELEARLPPGTVDHSTESIYKELPRWEESKKKARKRYREVICALADKFPNENLLLVTHGQAVRVSVSGFCKGIHTSHVNYCAFSHLQRQVYYSLCGWKAGNFKVLTENDKTGLSYTPLELSKGENKRFYLLRLVSFLLSYLLIFVISVLFTIHWI